MRFPPLLPYRLRARYLGAMLRPDKQLRIQNGCFGGGHHLLRLLRERRQRAVSALGPLDPRSPQREKTNDKNAVVERAFESRFPKILSPSK